MITDIGRFKNTIKIDDKSGCWNWIGHKDHRGYSFFGINKKQHLSYIASYKLFIGEIPKETNIIRICDNSSCVNPDHLHAQTLLERFEDKFIKLSTGCWEWIESKNKTGYGQISIKGKLQRANRISHELYIGPIPDGLYVCHRCDNTSCVNPNHLFLGTQSDNMKDASRKYRTGKIPKEKIEMIKSALDFGVTQKEVAEQFGISKGYAHNIYHKQRK